MTILYEHYELQEIPASKLSFWKAWHLIFYLAATVFGIFSYVFMENAMQLVDGNCPLYPRKLELRFVEITANFSSSIESRDVKSSEVNMEDSKMADLSNYVTKANETEQIEITATENLNSILGQAEQESRRRVVDTTRSLLGRGGACEVARFAPLLGSLAALLWATLFLMCPSGGHSRSGLKEPWRIVPPALVTAVALAALTGYSFALTDGGLRDFCHSFMNLTHSTSCSSVVHFVTSCDEGGCAWAARAPYAGRAAAAGAWASWLCACALLLARCLTARDFRLIRKQVCLQDAPKTVSSSKQPRSRQEDISVIMSQNTKDEPVIQFADLGLAEAVSYPKHIATTATVEDRRSEATSIV